MAAQGNHRTGCERSVDHREHVGHVGRGPIIEYARALLPDPKNRLFICGWQDEYTPGRHLVKMADRHVRNQTLNITQEDGKSIDVKVATRVGQYGLSAHSDADNITAMISAAKPRNVVFVHGEAAARASLKDALRGSEIAVADGDSIHLPAT